MSEPHERLRKLRIAKGFESAAAASSAFGWSDHTYKSHENGTRGIRMDAARRYALAYGSTAAYILGVGGGAETRNLDQVISVPVLARVSAGSFRLDEPLELEGTLVPAVPRKDVPASSQYSVVVDGPSVNKRIPDGAYAICVPFDLFPGGAQHGQLVHVVRERAGLHENTIKELRFTAKGMILMPASDDPRYQDQVELKSGDDGEIVRIQGIVIGSFIPM